MEQYIAQVNDFNMIAKSLFIASKEHQKETLYLGSNKISKEKKERQFITLTGKLWNIDEYKPWSSPPLYDDYQWTTAATKLEASWS